MPIYSYRCDSCGRQQDILRKMSDPPLTVCPACGASTLRKQVTAAGFQLKGSGWYVTDFRDGKGAAKADVAAPPAETSDGGTKTASADGPSAPAESTPAKTETAPAPAKSSAPPASGTS